MNKNIDEQYIDLLKDILENGIKKNDRTGTGTISVFGRQLRHSFKDGKFPLLTTKRIPFKLIVTELLWFLRGDTNIKYLVDNDCHIWDGDAYKNYVNKQTTEDVGSMSWFIEQIKTDDEFAEKWGDLGPVYGKQWRSCEHYDEIGQHYSSETQKIEKSDILRREPIDQIANLISDLKTNPDSRRLMVSAWNVGELDQMTLPPCHYGFQVYTRELSLEEKVDWLNKNYPTYGLGEWTIERLSDKDYLKEVEFEYNIPTRAISLMWNQRSVDTFLGLPFNIASYGLLLEIIAKEVNMVPDELIGNLGDTHLYLNHIEQAKEQIGRELTLEERYDLMPIITGHTKENIEQRKKLNNFEGNNGDSYHEEWINSFDIPKRTREPYPLPKLNIKLHFNNEPSFVPEHWLVDDFEIQDYISHSPIKAPLSN